MKKSMNRFGVWVMPALVLTVSACDSKVTLPTVEETVVDVALSVNEATGEFSTLIAALVAAELVDVLSGEGPFTVFAPTDAAFAALELNAGNVGALPVDALRSILLYHVAAGRRDAERVVSESSLTMVSGGTAEITVRPSGVFIEGARIVEADVAASNGVIHVIDAVLMP